jgi:S-sulfo-L-cysteine synthase (3-phospho-L-serine-dependent)
MTRRPCLVLVECNASYGRQLALRAPTFGVEAVVLAREPARFAGEARKGVLVRQCDTDRVDSVLDAVRDLRRSRDVRGVGSGYEGALAVAAAAARALGLPGPSATAAHDTRHKPRARALSNELVGNRVPFWVLSHVQDVARIAPEAYPIVCKPASSGGSLGVAACDSPAELAAHVETWLDESDERGRPLRAGLLAEQYVPGREYSVEVFDGVPLALTRTLLGGATGMVEVGHVVSPWSGAEEHACLEPYVAALVERLDLGWGPLHMEVRIADGVPRLIEANYRLAGGSIPDLVELATGVDMYDATLRRTLGIPAGVTPREASFAAIRFLLADRAGIVAATAGCDAARTTAGVMSAVFTTSIGSAVRPAERSGEYVGRVIAAGESPAASLAAAETGLSELQVTIRPATGAGAATQLTESAAGIVADSKDPATAAPRSVTGRYAA